MLLPSHHAISVRSKALIVCRELTSWLRQQIFDFNILRIRHIALLHLVEFTKFELGQFHFLNSAYILQKQVRKYRTKPKKKEMKFVIL